jgi:XTP/dITP diphosphohydrolase|tara:strand:+ start:603 stop:1355 length:753 start_codon:yes stop_codon:yes gene_type:complete
MDYKLEFEKLFNVMIELRAKCPWDIKQTNETLRYLTIEECYELSDAILENNPNLIKEELGDILLHVLFYAIIGHEQNQFNLAEVISSQTKKLIYRHPHIYGDVKVKDEKEVKKNWELLKLKENNKKSVLSGVPKSLPTMLKSYRLLEKVKGVGFDFPNQEGSFNNVLEELKELKLELDNNNINNATDEFGDLLFAIIGHAQSLGINAVNALEKTNKKFITKFNNVETTIKKENKSISDYSYEELNSLWDK